MRYGAVFLFLFFGTLMWGQAQMGKAASDGPQDGHFLENPGAMTQGGTAIAPDAEIITINGLCDSATKKTAPSRCKTVITRAQFETLIQYVQPKLAVADRGLFAGNYAQTLIRAQQAREMGLDSGPRFEALMTLRRDTVLQMLLGQALKERAEQVPEKDIEQFYKDNHESFEEKELEELYVPAAQQIPAVGDPEEVQKRRQDSILAMKKTADELRARAVTGEDFSRLQAEAYKAAGYGSTDASTKVEMQKRRRRDLRSPTEVSVMDLKPGEISQVFDEPNGHYIYKAGAKGIVPLEQVKDEISKKLSAERLQKYQKEVQEYATPAFDEKYFRVTNSTVGEP
jgi:hypothetical protein